MNSVNKTLYIPLYGKAWVSRQGRILHDPQAQRIWQEEGFPLHGKAASKWLAYNMGMRAAVFDQWLAEKLAEVPEAGVVHLGCGLDSRVNRVAHRGHLWFDVDLPEVMAQRRRFWEASPEYRMLDGDVTKADWLDSIPRDVPALMVMEGVSMYLSVPELTKAMARWRSHFSQAALLLDSYTVFAAKASRHHNPINQLGVTQLYGFDDPRVLTRENGFRFVREGNLTPDGLIAQLPRHQQGIFRILFAGSAARKIYRLYEYASE